MDLGRRVERRLCASQGPRPRLLLACGEERDQVGGLEELPEDGLERGRSLTKLSRLLLRQLRELGLELQVDPAWAVLDDDQRLRSERLQVAG